MHLLCMVGGLGAGVGVGGWWGRLACPPHTGPSDSACGQRAQHPFPLPGGSEWLHGGCVVLGPPVEELSQRLPPCLHHHSHNRRGLNICIWVSHPGSAPWTAAWGWANSSCPRAHGTCVCLSFADEPPPRYQCDLLPWCPSVWTGA